MPSLSQTTESFESLSALPDLFTDNKAELITNAARTSYHWLTQPAQDPSQQLWMPTYFQQVTEAPRQAANIVDHFADLGAAYADNNAETAGSLASAPQRVFTLAFTQKAMMLDNPDYNMTEEGQLNMHNLLQTIRDAAHTMATFNRDQPAADTTDRLLDLADYAMAQGASYMQMLNAYPV